MGDLPEVCHTAAVIAAPNSYQLVAIKRAIDGLNSINAILKLDTAQQRSNWYSKHYFGGGDNSNTNHMDALSPLPEVRGDRSDNRDQDGGYESDTRDVNGPNMHGDKAGDRDDRLPRSARKGDTFVGGAPEAVSMHRAEFEKIRRDHVVSDL